MKKPLLSVFTILSIALSPCLRAQTSSAEGEVSLEPTKEVESSLEFATDPLSETAPEPEGSDVGQASGEGARAAHRTQMRNIFVAIGAVGVAITAMLLVASNDGHKPHK